MFQCVFSKHCSVFCCYLITTSTLSVTTMKVCSKFQQRFYCGSMTLLQANGMTYQNTFLYIYTFIYLDFRFEF